MSKKGNKKSGKKNATTVDTETVVDLSSDDKTDIISDRNHDAITSDDLDAYLVDGGIPSVGDVTMKCDSAIDDSDNDTETPDYDDDIDDGFPFSDKSDCADAFGSTYMTPTTFSLDDVFGKVDHDNVKNDDELEKAPEINPIDMFPPFAINESKVDFSDDDSDCATLNDDVDSDIASPFESLLFDRDDNDGKHDDSESCTRNMRTDMTDSEREAMHDMIHRMENDIAYDELPAYAKPYDDMVNGVLELRREKAAKMYDMGEASRFLNDIDMHAFMSYGSTVPFMASKPVDDLCVEYGLGIHDSDNRDHAISTGDDYAWKKGYGRGLLWSEIIPTGKKSELRRENRSNPGTAAVDKAIADGFRHGTHLRKKFDIDGGAIRRITDDSSSWGFDTRQCWNLDSYIPALLYPRFAWLRHEAHGYNASFDSFNEYNRLVMDPILDALELHLVFYTIGDGDSLIADYCKENGLSFADNCLIEARAMQRIRHGYYLIAKYLFGFWD